MTIAIIDYGSGNLRSAAKAFERAVRECEGHHQVIVTSDADVVRKADRVVLPGVGAFGDCKAGLEAVPGMIEAISEVALTHGRPFLGICVGMQLLAQRSLEHGSHQGLGWLDADVVALDPADRALKVPHMGWNELVFDANAHPVLDGITPRSHAYFVHSFQMQVRNPADCWAHVDYGGPVAAIVGKGPIVGTQFHPEKSQALGLALITNFLRWKP